MKKFAIVLALSLTASGCAAGLAEQALNLPAGVLTASTANPVTKATLYRVENAYIVVLGLARQYKKLCNDGTLPASCITVTGRMQDYVRQARPLRKSLRTFVRKNDQVNAAVALRTLQDIFANIRNEAAMAGIPVPNTGG